MTVSKTIKDLTSWELAYPLSEELVSRWVSFSQGWDILGLWRVCAGCPCHLFVQGGRSDECHHFQWVLGERLLSQRWHTALGCHACCFHARNFAKLGACKRVVCRNRTLKMMKWFSCPRKLDAENLSKLVDWANFTNGLSFMVTSNPTSVAHLPPAFRFPNAICRERIGLHPTHRTRHDAFGEFWTTKCGPRSLFSFTVPLYTDHLFPKHFGVRDTFGIQFTEALLWN